MPGVVGAGAIGHQPQIRWHESDLALVEASFSHIRFSVVSLDQIAIASAALVRDAAPARLLTMRFTLLLILRRLLSSRPKEK